MLQSNYAQRFAGQNDILNKLNESLSPIVEAGPNQQGFSPQELASLTTTAVNNAAAANRNAQQAAGNFAAGQNNTSGLQSGVQKQIRGSIASSAANQESNALNQITQANYNQGNQNFWRAQGGMSALSGQYNPAEFGSLSNNANEAAFGEADKIQQEKNAEQAAIAGGIANIGIDFATGGLASGAKFGGGLGGFLKGGLAGLGGNTSGGSGGSGSGGGW